MLIARKLYEFYKIQGGLPRAERGHSPERASRAAQRGRAHLGRVQRHSALAAHWCACVASAASQWEAMHSHERRGTAQHYMMRCRIIVWQCLKNASLLIATPSAASS